MARDNVPCFLSKQLLYGSAKAICSWNSWIAFRAFHLLSNTFFFFFLKNINNSIYNPCTNFWFVHQTECFRLSRFFVLCLTYGGKVIWEPHRRGGCRKCLYFRALLITQEFTVCRCKISLQCIYFGICRGIKGKLVVQEEDGENRIIWKRMSYTRQDLQPWAFSIHDDGDCDGDDISGSLFAAVTKTYHM